VVAEVTGHHNPDIKTVAARQIVKAAYVSFGKKDSAIIARREIGSGKLNPGVSSLKKKSRQAPTITTPFAEGVKGHGTAHLPGSPGL
jgi:hypothetical protein